MASLKDIAKAAGVSSATVSRALNDSPLIKDETKQNVRRIAREMNYELPISPRSLVDGKSWLVGLIVPDMSNLFFSEIAKGIERRLRQDGYSLILYNTDGELYQEKAGIKNMRKYNVDGVICFPSTAEDQHLRSLMDQGIPVVLLDSKLPGFTVVRSDNEKGAYYAVQHLIRLGHRRIAFLSGRMEVSGRLDRYQGYRKALLDNSIAVDESLLIQGSVKRQHGYDSTKKLMQLSQPPTAIMTQNDVIALGALTALDELGYKVPEDIALVGYDDTVFASVTRPTLTSVAQPKYEMGYLAAEHLLRLIDHDQDSWEKPTKVVLQPNLVIRDSTIVKSKGSNT